jgi:hypothetical protein
MRSDVEATAVQRGASGNIQFCAMISREISVIGVQSGYTIGREGGGDVCAGLSATGLDLSQLFGIPETERD